MSGSLGELHRQSNGTRIDAPESTFAVSFRVLRLPGGSQDSQFFQRRECFDRDEEQDRERLRDSACHSRQIANPKGLVRMQTAQTSAYGKHKEYSVGSKSVIEKTSEEPHLSDSFGSLVLIAL